MARKTVECKILRFEERQDGFTAVYIQCKIGQHEWVRELWVKYDKPISMEMFIREFKKTGVFEKQPTDMLAYVKQEADKPFTLTIDDKNSWYNYDMNEENTEQQEQHTTDSAVATLTHTEGEPSRKTYIVTSKAGLFKNGTQYSAGDEIQLDDHTANNFMALDEVEEKDV